MGSVRDDVLGYNGVNPTRPELSAPAAAGSGEGYLEKRALARVTQAAWDLYQALAAGDMHAARWLVDGVHVQVASLAGETQLK